MKHPVAILILSLLATPAWAADPLSGLWRTQAGRDGGFAHVRIAPCEAALCGTVVATFDRQGQATPAEALGQVILTGILPAGVGQYGKGRILDPESRRSYVARLELQGDQLNVGGCIMIVCRQAGVWQRVQ